MFLLLVILEILEHGIDVLHICGDPILEAHSQNIWKYIKVKRISERVFIYKMKKKGSIIKLGSKRYFEKKFDI